MVGLGQDGDHALHLVRELEVWRGGDQQAGPLATGIHVLQQDGGTEPGGHLWRVAPYRQPARLGGLGIKPGGISNAPADLRDGSTLVDGRRRWRWRSVQRRLLPPVGRTAEEGQLTEALPHVAPIRAAVVAPDEGR